MRKKVFASLCLMLCSALLLSACQIQKQKSKIHLSTVAMGSAVTATAYGATEESAKQTVQKSFEAISILDTQILSKALPSSEVYRLNHTAHEEPQSVCADLLRAVAQTKQVYQHSTGQAAVLSGALTELWGIDTDDFHLPTHLDIQLNLPFCEDNALQCDMENNQLSFPKKSVLNLGSVGKGMACDSAVEIYKSAIQSGTLSGAVISVGGSIGAVGLPKGKETWTIGIRNPFDTSNVYFAQLKLPKAFLSTSGTYEKQFTENGKTYHHLLDLQTGYPKETDLVSVTVQAPTGLLSDALSTLCFLIGEAKSMPILKEYQAEAVFVYQDKSVHITEGLSSAFTLQDSSFKAVTVQ